MANEDWTVTQAKLLSQLNMAALKARDQRRSLVEVVDAAMRFYADLASKCTINSVLAADYGKWHFQHRKVAATELLRQLKLGDMSAAIGWQLRTKLTQFAEQMR